LELHESSHISRFQSDRLSAPHIPCRKNFRYGKNLSILFVDDRKDEGKQVWITSVFSFLSNDQTYTKEAGNDFSPFVSRCLGKRVTS
jgi:hypothetical protein